MTRRKVQTLEREPLTFLSAGAHRGAELDLPTLAAWNADTSRAPLVPRYVDPVPGRATALARTARERGIPAEVIEARIEDVLLREELPPQPLVLHVDRAGTIATALLSRAAEAVPVLGYLLVRLPSGELLGLRFVVAPGDHATRRALAAFMARLDLLTHPSGSSSILGEEGRPEHLLAEDEYRAWMAEHLTANLLAITSGLPARSHPIEVTADGRETMPLLIHVAPDFSDARELAEQVVAELPHPIARAGGLWIADVARPGIRFHRARLRQLDGRLSVNGFSAFDEDAVREAVERREAEERRRQAAQVALERASRQTVSMTNPVWSTD